MKKVKKLRLGVDAGSFEGKVAGPYGAHSFKSNISKYVERKVEESFGEDDMEFDFAGKKGLAGSIAESETRFGAKGRYGKTKAHWQTQVRVLLAIYQYTKKYDIKAETVSIVVGQPYDGHTEDEKTRLKKLLLGSHNIQINGENVTITIGEVGVSPEGASAFWSIQHTPTNYPTCRILDFGSGTVNALGFENFRVINAFSDTFNYGTMTMELDDVVEGAIQDTIALGWERNDLLLVCGGVAEEVAPEVTEHYPKTEVIFPVLVLEDESEQVLEPKFCNAVGNYNLAKGSFK